MDVKDVIGDSLAKIIEAATGKKRHAELAEAVNKLVASLQTGAFVVSSSDLDKKQPDERSERSRRRRRPPRRPGGGTPGAYTARPVEPVAEDHRRDAGERSEAHRARVRARRRGSAAAAKFAKFASGARGSEAGAERRYYAGARDEARARARGDARDVYDERRRSRFDDSRVPSLASRRRARRRARGVGLRRLGRARRDRGAADAQVPAHRGVLVDVPRARASAPARRPRVRQRVPRLRVRGEPDHRQGESDADAGGRVPPPGDAFARDARRAGAHHRRRGRLFQQPREANRQRGNDRGCSEIVGVRKPRTVPRRARRGERGEADGGGRRGADDDFRAGLHQQGERGPHRGRRRRRGGGHG